MHAHSRFIAKPQPPPRLSVIVVLYDMEREAGRSLHSLSARYQQGIAEADYEVVVVDNGSPRPFRGGSVAELGANFSYHYLPKVGVSPAAALNHGARAARADYLALMIDGARIVTPGLLRHGLLLRALFDDPCGYTHGWHLGPDLQCRSIESGYDREREDALLAGIAWPRDGYRLFEIAALHGEMDGWFGRYFESNCTFVRRDTFFALGGADERFRTAGGGLVNLDLQYRITEHPSVTPVMILGEGTFHQLHGGATSSTPWSALAGRLDEFTREYRELRGTEFSWRLPDRPLQYFGHVPASAAHWLEHSARQVQPELERLNETTRWLHLEVRQRDETVVWLHREVASRDATVAWLHAEVAQRDALVEELRRQIAAASLEAIGGSSRETS